MRKPFRRFELLLPTKLNSGLPIADDAFGETLLELRDRFGAVSTETQTIAGQWRHEGEFTGTNRFASLWTCPIRQRTASFSSASRKS